jgi:hypothetical protein
MIIAALTAVAAAVAAAAALADTSVKDYVVPVGDEYVVDALFSVDDEVPVLGASPTGSEPTGTATAHQPCT